MLETMSAKSIQLARISFSFCLIILDFCLHSIMIKEHSFCWLVSFFLTRYFLHLYFKCYPKSPLYPPRHALQPTHSCLLALAFPCTGAYNLGKTKGHLYQQWLSRPSSPTYAARKKKLWGYWLVYIVVPPIRLQTPLAL